MGQYKLNNTQNLSLKVVFLILSFMDLIIYNFTPKNKNNFFKKSIIIILLFNSIFPGKLFIKSETTVFGHCDNFEIVSEIFLMFSLLIPRPFYAFTIFIKSKTDAFWYSRKYFPFKIQIQVWGSWTKHD